MARTNSANPSLFAGAHQCRVYTRGDARSPVCGVGVTSTSVGLLARYRASISQLTPARSALARAEDLPSENSIPGTPRHESIADDITLTL